MQIKECFLPICLLALCPMTIFSQENQLSVDKQHMAGLVEAHLASLEGWRTGDLLIRSKESGDGRYFRVEDQDRDGVEFKYVEGPDAMNAVTSRDLLIRFIFDFDKKRVLIINRIEDEERVFDGLEEEVGRPVRRMDDRVLLYDGTNNTGLARLEAGVVHQLRNSPPLDQLLASWAVPNVRGLGCTSTGLSVWDFERLRKQVELVGNIDTMVEINNTGRNRYQVQSRFGGNLSVPGRVYVDWDTQRNLPVKVTSYFSNRENVPYNYASTADWISIDGHYVPVSARVSRRSLPVFVDRKFHMKTEATVDLHWFSFNKELSEELFDEKLLHDRKKLDEMLSEEVFETKSADK